MKEYKIESSTDVEVRIADVFCFFDRPENLEKMTPSLLSFKIMTPGSVTMETGRCIDYCVKVLGIPTRWTSLIQDYDPPNKFTDIQLKGPYSFWHHQHLFEQVSENVTRIRDEVRYVVPFGLFGRIAHFLFIKPQLKYIFSYRKKFMQELYKGKVISSELRFT